MSHDVTGKATVPSPARPNRRARRSRRWASSAVLVGAVGVGAPLALMTTPSAAATPTVSGYTLITSAGGVFNFGAAPVIQGGALGASPSAVVGIAPDSTGKGYWVATANGGVFSYGDAKFYGSAGNIALKAPIVGIVATEDGGGYYLVASDGGVFAFGDAKFYGSAGSLNLVAPIVGLSITSTGAGYYLVGADGGVFTFGDAAFAGTLSSTFGGPSPDGPAVGIAADPTGPGYLIATAQGAIVSYGGAPFFGSPALSGVTPAAAARLGHLRARRDRVLGRRGRRRRLHLQLVGDDGYGIVVHARHHRERPLLRLGPQRDRVLRHRQPRHRGGIRADPLRPSCGAGAVNPAPHTHVRRAPRREGLFSSRSYVRGVGASCGVTRRRRRR